jgi:CBS domain containing-hemolysin-like protein
MDVDSRMVGIVSLEDVLEELVGDIRDEFDIETGPFYEKHPNSVLVDAELPVRDLALETGWPLPTQSNDSLEDWCVARWGRVPNRGEKLRVENFVLIADQVSGGRLWRVRINYYPPETITPQS